jgi:hypothetical protein
MNINPSSMKTDNVNHLIQPLSQTGIMDIEGHKKWNGEERESESKEGNKKTISEEEDRRKESDERQISEQQGSENETGNGVSSVVEGIRKKEVRNDRNRSRRGKRVQLMKSWGIQKGSNFIFPGHIHRKHCKIMFSKPAEGMNRSNSNGYENLLHNPMTEEKDNNQLTNRKYGALSETSPDLIEGLLPVKRHNYGS